MTNGTNIVHMFIDIRDTNTELGETIITPCNTDDTAELPLELTTDCAQLRDTISTSTPLPPDHAILAERINALNVYANTDELCIQDLVNRHGVINTDTLPRTLGAVNIDDCIRAYRNPTTRTRASWARSSDINGHALRTQYYTVHCEGFCSPTTPITNGTVRGIVGISLLFIALNLIFPLSFFGLVFGGAVGFYALANLGLMVSYFQYRRALVGDNELSVLAESAWAHPQCGAALGEPVYAVLPENIHPRTLIADALAVYAAAKYPAYTPAWGNTNMYQSLVDLYEFECAIQRDIVAGICTEHIRSRSSYRAERMEYEAAVEDAIDVFSSTTRRITALIDAHTAQQREIKRAQQDYFTTHTKTVDDASIRRASKWRH